MIVLANHFLLENQETGCKVLYSFNKVVFFFQFQTESRRGVGWSSGWSHCSEAKKWRTHGVSSKLCSGGLFYLCFAVNKAGLHVSNLGTLIEELPLIQLVNLAWFGWKKVLCWTFASYLTLRASFALATQLQLDSSYDIANIANPWCLCYYLTIFCKWLVYYLSGSFWCTKDDDDL